MKIRTKKIIGWILVAIYFIIPPFGSYFCPFAQSPWECWGLLNIIIIIAIWELLIRDWLFGES